MIGIAACSDRPSRERFPGPQGNTTDLKQAATQKAVLGGFDSLNNPLPGEGGGQNVAPSNGRDFVAGSVTLAKQFKFKPGMFFFIAIRRPEGGPPLAVKREQGEVKFPYKFRLSSQDAMIPGTRLEGQLVITARIDADGDPMSRQKGDASGTLVTEAGQENLQVVIDEPVGD